MRKIKKYREIGICSNDYTKNISIAFSIYNAGLGVDYYIDDSVLGINIYIIPFAIYIYISRRIRNNNEQDS